MVKINSGNYVEEVLRTESNDFEAIRERLKNPQIIRLLHASLGLVTEASEFADAIKKHIFYGKPLDGINLEEEIGDSMWYAALAVDVLSTTFDEVLSNNIEKLKKRFPEKFSNEDAIERDTNKELSHFKPKVQPGPFCSFLWQVGVELGIPNVDKDTDPLDILVMNQIVDRMLGKRINLRYGETGQIIEGLVKLTGKPIEKKNVMVGNLTYMILNHYNLIYRFSKNRYLRG